MNGIRMNGRACEGTLNGGRMVLGRDGRWWIREQICYPGKGEAVRDGTWRWSGDTLVVALRGGYGYTPPAEPIGVRRGDTLDVHTPSFGIHVYRYVRQP